VLRFRVHSKGLGLKVTKKLIATLIFYFEKQLTYTRSKVGNLSNLPAMFTVPS